MVKTASQQTSGSKIKDSCYKKEKTETTKFNQPQNKMPFHPQNHRTLFTLQNGRGGS